MTEEDKKLATEVVDEFLPSGYTPPADTSNYMKFVKGANAFRVLSSAITGFEYWSADNKPVRSKNGWVEKPQDIRVEKDGSYRINHFWAFAVWNYQTESIQVLEITQKSIQKAITALISSKGWGSPKDYDLVITKEGEGLETEYTVMPEPKKELELRVKEAYNKAKLDLSKLYSGENPFI